MLPEVTGLPLEEAEALLRAAGAPCTLCRTASPFSHAAAGQTIERNYALRYVSGELTYASFPVLSMYGQTAPGAPEGQRAETESPAVLPAWAVPAGAAPTREGKS